MLTLQALVWHDLAVAFCGSGHCFPQPPQWSIANPTCMSELVRFASHPLSYSPSQSSYPAAQETIVHVLATQDVAVVFEESGQVLPQPPQFAGSDEKSVLHRHSPGLTCAYVSHRLPSGQLASGNAQEPKAHLPRVPPLTHSASDRQVKFVGERHPLVSMTSAASANRGKVAIRIFLPRSFPRTPP